MKRLTDPEFRYVPAARTDIRKTFAKIRAEQKKAAQAPVNVTELRKKK